MKKLYTLGMALAMVAFGTQSFAQINEVSKPLMHTKGKDYSPSEFSKKKVATQKDDEDVYFYEDFSNGFDGMDDNGAWTTGEENGNLWFQTFPVGSPDGYSTTAPVLGGQHPDYQDNLPLYFSSTGNVVNSPTMDNGVMMIDADRYNSGGEATITATLISPVFDLSEAESSDLLLVFYQKLRLCCDNASAVSVDLSTNGGGSWIPYDAFTPFGAVNENIDREISLDISDLIENTSDLSNMRIRFNWYGPQSAYYWFIDDVSIQKVPDNNLEGLRTFTNNYIDYRNEFNTDSVGLSQGPFYGAFEYREEPEYYTRPLNFAMEVRNNGLLTQTDVRLKVVGTAPVSGTTHEWTSAEGIEIERGVMDTVRIANALLSDISGEIEVGQYIFEFSVVQAEAEQTPEDNVGPDRQSTITREWDHGGRAMMRNDANVPTTSRYALGEDVIWGNNYVFPELQDGVGAKYITHVETVFAWISDWAETQVGEEVYFNVRENSPLFGGPYLAEGLENHVLFGTHNLLYDDADLTFTIGPDDIWDYDTGLPMVWASFELPNPVLITPGVVYQAEYRVPAVGADIVYPQLTARYMEPFGSTVYDFDGDGGWFILGSSTTDRWNGIPLRFRTAGEPDGIEKITVESGITLVQNYPNPFTETTNIQFSLEESAKVQLEVRDLSGKLVFSKDFGTIPANVAQRYDLQRGNLAAGMYTYTIATPEFQVSRKLTVQ